jgi:ribosomal protein L3 glutamine methyltransferase
LSTALHPAELGALVEDIERRFLSAGLAFGHGSLTAFDEAAYAALSTLGLPLDALDENWKRPLDVRERSAIEELVRQRIETRKPMAYLTREAWLGPHRFYVDERVIVPRSFIAEALEEQLAPWLANPHAVTSVLDLCTGSACLAILAAYAFPAARVDAADISRDALDVARINVEAHGLGARVTTIESDLFDALGGRTYDVIVSNPPYVTGRAMRALPAEYRREPALALASGEDGLDHTRRILSAARPHLREDGILVVEVGFNREGVEAAFPALPFVWLETSAGDGVVFLLEAKDVPY